MGARARSTVGAVTFLAMASGAFPVYGIGALGPVLIDRLGTDRTGVGALTMLVFAGAAASSASIGRLADRAGARRALTVAMGLALALAATAFVLPGYVALAAWALVAGPLLATGNPVCNRLIAGLPAGERGVVMGVKQAGVQAATVIAGLVAPPLAVLYGWRVALAAGATLPLLVLLALPALPRLAPASKVRRPPVSRADAADAPPVAVGRLRTYAFLMGAGVSCILAFLPVYASDTGILGPVGAGALLSALGANGALARVVLGREAERSGVFATRLGLFGMGGALGIGLLVLAGLLSSTGGPAVVLVVVAAVVLGWSAISWNVVAMLYVVVAAGRADAGSASGRVLVGFYTGVAATPALFGLLVESGLPYPLVWGVVAALFCAAARVGVGVPEPADHGVRSGAHS